MLPDLAAHQWEALQKMTNGSIVTGGTGVGKSRVGAAYYIHNEAPKDIYVITTAKKRDSLDWETEFVKFGVGKELDATNAGILTVDSWNNIAKYVNVRNAFFIFDEQRLVGAGTWTKSFVKIAEHNNWIMLTATPGDTWIDYIPVFVAHGFYKNRTDFKRQHVVYSAYTKYPKIDHYIGVGQLLKHKYSILVHMPYERHTTRHDIIVPVEYDQDLFKKVSVNRWHVYENRPLRDVAELFSVMRKVVNSDSSRLQSVKSLLRTHPRLIVFYNHDPELHLLRSLANEWNSSSDSKCTSGSGNGSELVIAEWNGHRHQPLPTSPRWVYLVQYAAGSEAWDCTETDAMVFFSLTYSWKAFEQAHGRIERMNTKFKDLYYYIFMSDSLIDKAVWKALSHKKDFNQKRFEQGLVDI
jgi:hypothetical protein